ncbi:phosphotransferase enzyme family protein [Agrococcus sp. Marseille-P2731]|uniref:phosphotransferase enzyme family protein n=1 Tax=Agrococcus sp. Marseille-P2731 TaxID=1841862 RepID=UPI0009300F9B|nr:phosphotransferase [Agrococcus sp. Marseille-P2731]
MDAQERPALEMLWEAHDPARVLERRFGFESAADVAEWVRAMLRRHWGIDVDVCERVVMSDRNALAWVRVGRSRMVLKWTGADERFERLRALAALVHWLAARGVPVSAPVPAADGSLQVETEGVSMGLQHEVAGRLLDAEDPAQVVAAGRALALLHAELRDARAVTSAFGDEPAPLPARLAGWLDAAPGHLDPVAVALLERCRSLATPGLSTQLVHGDVRAANVLCSEDGIAAFLDFEDARIDDRIVELARTAVLLGTRFHHWGPVGSDTHKALLQGYESVAGLTAAERQWWPVLLLWTTLAFVPPGHDSTGWTDAAAALRDRLAAQLQ